MTTTIFGENITELRDLCSLADVDKWFTERGFSKFVEDQDTYYRKAHDNAGFDICFMVTNTTVVPYDADLSEHCVYLCTYFDDGELDPLLQITKRWKEDVNG